MKIRDENIETVVNRPQWNVPGTSFLFGLKKSLVFVKWHIDIIMTKKMDWKVDEECATAIAAILSPPIVE